MPLACIHASECFILHLSSPSERLTIIFPAAGFPSVVTVTTSSSRYAQGLGCCDSHGQSSTSLLCAIGCHRVFLLARDIERLRIEVPTSASSLNQIKSGKALGWKEQKGKCISMITFAFPFCQCEQIFIFPVRRVQGKSVSRPRLAISDPLPTPLGIN